MRKSIVLASMAALGLGSQAFAEDNFSYSFLEADYVNTNLDSGGLGGIDDNATGFGLKGSIAFTDMLHGYVDYSKHDFDFDFGGGLSGSFNLEIWEVGVGLNHAINPKIDLIGRAGYTKWDADVVDDDGFALQAGVRGRPAPNFEVEGLVHYVDMSDFGNATSGVVNGRYFFMPQFAVGAGVEFSDDATTWNVGFRWNFNSGK